VWCSPECSAVAARRKRLDEHFSITPEEYDEILAHQGGKCAICRRLPKPGKRLAVDHSHVTTYVRGLLCFVCNRRFMSSRGDGIIEAMYRYVTDPPARHVVGDRSAPGRPPKKRAKRKPRRRAR
jgi:hypothetical protein